MSKKFVSLFMAGEQYDYVYYPDSDTVCTQMFPDVPIQKVFLNCFHHLNHDQVRDLIKDKLKSYELLENAF